jgi:glycosyltransferase involved in cell wall biosynthesis
MRSVVQITPYYPPHLGGLENVVAALAHELSNRHAVTVQTTDIGAKEAPRSEVDGRVTVRRHRAIEVAHTPIAPGLLPALLRTPRDSVWHLHTAHAVLPEQVAFAAALKRQRFLVHFHLDVDPSGRFGWLLPRYKRVAFGRVLRAAAGVLVLTDTQAQFVRDTYGVDPAKVFVVPNGVGDTFFLPERQRSDGPLKLLFVGRLSPQKNIGRLLEAVSKVRSEVTLDIVGDGEQRALLDDAVRSLGLANVSFLGRRAGADLVGRYADADAFVLPSEKEGMPLAALEAMAAGMPIIATRVTGNTELLTDVGLLVEPNAVAIAEAIDEVASDADAWRGLADRSAVASRAYSWDAVTRRVEDVYAEVLS